MASMHISLLFILSIIVLSVKPSFSESGWIKSQASSYGSSNGNDTYGACYGKLDQAKGLGALTFSASSILFGNGSLNDCGACYQVRCIDARYCKTSSPVTVTLTNHCVDKAGNGTKRCAYPRFHLSLSKPAFRSIGALEAGALAVEFRRVSCERKGQIQVFISGNPYFIVFTFLNVGEGGSLSKVWVKGDSGWIAAKLSFGASWHVAGKSVLKRQSLSFILEDKLTGTNLTVYDVTPDDWKFKKIYYAGQFGTPTPAPVPSPPPSSNWLMGASASLTGNNAGTNNYGACYGNLPQARVIGNLVAAGSSALFGDVDDNECGSCFELKCKDNLYCSQSGKTVIVTIANRCVKMNNGTQNRCEKPRKHFVLTKPAFANIASFKAGSISVQYRRVACPRKGKIHFYITGNRYWIVVTILNVGGPGSLKSIAIKGTNTKWFSMTNSWGAYWRIGNQPKLYGQALSFKLFSRLSNLSLTIPNVAPSNWTFNQTYVRGQFASLY